MPRAEPVTVTFPRPGRQRCDLHDAYGIGDDRAVGCVGDPDIEGPGTRMKDTEALPVLAVERRLARGSLLAQQDGRKRNAPVQHGEGRVAGVGARLVPRGEQLIRLCRIEIR